MRTTITIIGICVILIAGANLFAEVINVPDDFDSIQAAISDEGTQDGDRCWWRRGSMGKFKLFWKRHCFDG